MNVRGALFPKDPDSLPNHVLPRKLIIFGGTADLSNSSVIASDEEKMIPSASRDHREIVESIHKIPDAIKQEIHSELCRDHADLRGCIVQCFGSNQPKKQTKSNQEIYSQRICCFGQKTTDLAAVDRVFELERQIIHSFDLWKLKLDFEEPISTTNERKLIEETQRFLPKSTKRFFGSSAG